MKKGLSSLSPETQLQLYAGMLKPRIFEEKMLLLLRQGKISKWFSGIGQEAISVGSVMAIDPEEYVLPLHRNLGVFTSRNVPLDRLFAQFQGKPSGFSKGRERSFHFGSREHHIVGMISHLGPQLAVADGIALAHTLDHEPRVTLAFSGDGGTSQGDFHEALNVAAVWDLPVIFIIENNGYGLSTPVSEQYRCEKLSDRALGYGIEGVQIDGNDIVEVYNTVRSFAESLRTSPRPVLIECMTFRMRGHEEASGTKYVPPELFEEWARRDPVKTFEDRLIQAGILNPQVIEGARREMAHEIDAAIERASAEADPVSDSDRELGDVFAPYNFKVQVPATVQRTSRRFVDALTDALREALLKHQRLVLMGQDIAEYGGVFKVTEGLAREFGNDRVRNTPLCESAIIGTGLGLSIGGYKSVIEMQFADFVTCGFNQIVNNLAKSHWRWGQHADVVVRLPTGAGMGAGPFHSQSNEAWFCHTPGLKVVYPTSAEDAKGLLLASIEDPNPVLFFEHKGMYRTIEERIPDGYYTTEIGKGKVLVDGDAVSIITYGMGVHWAMKYLAQHPEISARVVDLRTLIPFDRELIIESVKKTSRVLVLHEATLTGGFGAEIAAFIARECFAWLDAPVTRCASLDTPVPFSSVLEAQFLANSRLDQELQRLLAY